MNKTLIASIAVVAALAAVPASAQMTFSYGATLTSNYISRGATQTNGNAAFQPWAEVESNGWYAGIWASNVRFAPDSIEVDLYGGYRWAASEIMNVDIGYAQYFYNSTGNCCGELYMRGDLQAGTANISGGIALNISGGLAFNDAHIGISTPLYGNLTGSMTFGVTGIPTTYGNVGVSYAVNDNWSVDARYHRGANEGERFVVSTDISF